MRTTRNDGTETRAGTTGNPAPKRPAEARGPRYGPQHQHAPQPLPDFDEHGKRAIADTYDIGPLPAFLTLWWGQYAIARDPELEAHMADLHRRAVKEDTDVNEFMALFEDSSTIRHRVRELEPGQ